LFIALSFADYSGCFVTAGALLSSLMATYVPERSCGYK